MVKFFILVPTIQSATMLYGTHRYMNNALRVAGRYYGVVHDQDLVYVDLDVVVATADVLHVDRDPTRCVAAEVVKIWIVQVRTIQDLFDFSQSLICQIDIPVSIIQFEMDRFLQGSGKIAEIF